MRTALLEIQGTSVPSYPSSPKKLTLMRQYACLQIFIEKFSPDRIIIESSGSAFPATLAWQVKQLEHEGLMLDAVISEPVIHLLDVFKRNHKDELS